MSHAHLLQGHPNSVQSHQLEDVQLQQAPHEHLHAREDAREAGGQIQQPLRHQAPHVGCNCWSGGQVVRRDRDSGPGAILSHRHKALGLAHRGPSGLAPRYPTLTSLGPHSDPLDLPSGACVAWWRPAGPSPSSWGASSSSCCNSGVPLTASCLGQGPKVSLPTRAPVLRGPTNSACTPSCLCLVTRVCAAAARSEHASQMTFHP